MKPQRRDLETLFSPPPNQFGTHMLVCGLSADTETLERIASTFTGEHAVERAANGLPRALLMLDASAPRLGALAVPGMLQLVPCAVQRWSTQTTLMHAKVALLGFADVRFGAPTTFRLLVSTGNWTRESWGSDAQIDMFWSTEYRIDPASARDEAFADVAAALVFFERLMSGLYTQSSAFLASQPLALGWLDTWKAMLHQGRRSKASRFIHSLDAPLFAQIKQRFTPEGVSTMVVGSGFWEQADSASTGKPEVLERLDELAVRGERYLVANPQQAGALAPWTAANPKAVRNGKIGGWTLCAPFDPLQKGRHPGRKFLHAKYIAGLARVAPMQDDKGTLTFLYLGSGNLSRAGLLSRAALGIGRAARQRAGNIEAGVLLTDRQEVKQVWRVLACGDVLPEDAIRHMAQGTGEPILVPRVPPPVLFARVEGNALTLVRSDDPPADLEVQLDASSAWLEVAAGDDAVTLTQAVPPFVRVRLAGTADAREIHEIPVFSEDGICCRQPPNALKIDDVLEALLAFPAAPPCPPDPEPLNSAALPAATVSSAASRYPLKTMASLIEVIGQRNALVEKEQFLVWLSQLRYLMLEQIAAADRDAIRRARINLFPALCQPGFVPPWLHASPQLELAYRNLVRDIEDAWTVSGAAACPAATLN